MRLQLLGGADVRRSVLASGQRSENLFPEKNAEGSVSPVTLYQRPGLRLIGAPTVAGAWRGFWQAGQRAFGVCGKVLVEINKDFTTKARGAMAAVVNPRVAMIDNRQQLIIAQGAGPAYTLDLTNPNAEIVQQNDPTGFFTGADVFGYCDTFVLWNTPGANTFQSSLSNTFTFDSTYLAGLTSGTGDLVGLAVCRGNILLIAQRHTEIWTNSGAAAFPFARLPNANFEHGCCAVYTIIASGENVYWLGQDHLGQGHVYRVTGYKISVVSDLGVELSINRLSPQQRASAWAYAHQNDGHRFIVLTFPDANLVWAYDELTDDWHQRPGIMLACAGNIQGATLAGDANNSNLYVIDPTTYQDNGQPITFLRTFGHIAAVSGPQGPQPLDGHVIEVTKFVLDIEVGTTLDVGTAEIVLRYSSDRGKTFGPDLTVGVGASGEYEVAPTLRVLGRARDFVFEVQWSFNGQVALQGAWLDAVMVD